MSVSAVSLLSLQFNSAIDNKGEVGTFVNVTNDNNQLKLPNSVELSILNWKYVVGMLTLFHNAVPFKVMLIKQFPSFCINKGGGESSVVFFFSDGFKLPKFTTSVGKEIAIAACIEIFLSSVHAP